MYATLNVMGGPITSTELYFSLGQKQFSFSSPHFAVPSQRVFVFSLPTPGAPSQQVGSPFLLPHSVL